MTIWARRCLSVVLSVAALAIGLSVSARAHGDAVWVGSLGLGDELFWEGTTVGSDPVHSLPFMTSLAPVPRCDVPEHPCETFELAVTEAGAQRLRVSLDTPERDDGFELLVESPNEVVTRAVTSNTYSVEVNVGAPEVGTWHVYVAPYGAEDAPVRLRAKLEDSSYEPVANENGELLPNLVVTRTWEFGFAAPINPLNGPFLASDDMNPPAAAGPVQPVSCSPDEQIGDEAVRCLRYSFGLGNGGEGPFGVRWTGDRATEMSHDVFQCIKKTDGTFEARPAGTGSYHQTHSHWHYDDVVWHRLYKVEADGTLTPAGDGKKIGYSPAAQGLVGWERFTQDRNDTAGNCVPDSNNSLGLARGWGDAYRYQRAGNYVHFPVDGDGEYVVLTIADPENNVAETDDADNTYYTHITVTGNDVEVHEQGYGTSHLDPDKTIVADWWVD